MNVRMVDDKYFITKITGPSHNYLGIVIGARSTDSEPLVIDLEKKPSERGIQAKCVEEQVIKALSEFNDAYNKSLVISKIEFISSDTMSNNIYSELALAILKHAMQIGAD